MVGVTLMDGAELSRSMSKRAAPNSKRADEPTEHHEKRRSMGVEEVRELYAGEAEALARLSWVDHLLVGRYRRRLFGRAGGRVLDVACGTGTNARYLPEDAEYVGVDVSPEMLRIAEETLDRLERDAVLLEMDAQSLGFPDDSFQTVVSSLSTCTFPDPVSALREMERVCAPDGRILLLEHGRSDVGPIARLQDWRADAHYRKHACRLNQDPIAVVSRAGLSVRATETGLLGVLTAIEARPTAGSS